MMILVCVCRITDASEIFNEVLGIVSIIMLWGMLEIGVATMASCLPTLRPLFQGWSLKSIIASIRSTIYLRPMGSAYKHSGDERGTSESETAITGVAKSGKSSVQDLNTIDVEAYAMGKISADKGEGEAGGEGIWRKTGIKQTSEAT